MTTSANTEVSNFTALRRRYDPWLGTTSNQVVFDIICVGKVAICKVANANGFITMTIDNTTTLGRAYLEDINIARM